MSTRITTNLRRPTAGITGASPLSPPPAYSPGGFQFPQAGLAGLRRNAQRLAQGENLGPAVVYIVAGPQNQRRRQRPQLQLHEHGNGDSDDDNDRRKRHSPNPHSEGNPRLLIRTQERPESERSERSSHKRDPTAERRRDQRRREGQQRVANWQLEIPDSPYEVMPLSLSPLSSAAPSPSSPSGDSLCSAASTYSSIYSARTPLTGCPITAEPSRYRAPSPLGTVPRLAPPAPRSPTRNHIQDRSQSSAPHHGAPSAPPAPAFNRSPSPTPFTFSGPYAHVASAHLHQAMGEVITPPIRPTAPAPSRSLRSAPSRSTTASSSRSNTSTRPTAPAPARPAVNTAISTADRVLKPQGHARSRSEADNNPNPRMCIYARSPTIYEPSPVSPRAFVPMRSNYALENVPQLPRHKTLGSMPRSKPKGPAQAAQASQTPNRSISTSKITTISKTRVKPAGPKTPRTPKTPLSSIPNMLARERLRDGAVSPFPRPSPVHPNPGPGPIRDAWESPREAPRTPKTPRFEASRNRAPTVYGIISTRAPDEYAGDDHPLPPLPHEHDDHQDDHQPELADIDIEVEGYCRTRALPTWRRYYHRLL